MHVHGNTTLEITWTVVPLLILVLIAIPTRDDDLQDAGAGAVRRAPGRGDRPPVVVGVPLSAVQDSSPRTSCICRSARRSNFTLNSADVIHSFWVPALSGKRDVMPVIRMRSRTHEPPLVHARFDDGRRVQRRVRRVLRHEPREHAVQGVHGERRRISRVGRSISRNRRSVRRPPPAACPRGRCRRLRRRAAARPSRIPRPLRSPRRAPAPSAPGGLHRVPREQIAGRRGAARRRYPSGLNFDDNLLGKGDPANGAKLMIGAGTCLAVPHDQRQPDDGSASSGRTSRTSRARTTIAAGLYPNDAQHLARWIKNARSDEARRRSCRARRRRVRSDDRNDVADEAGSPISRSPTSSRIYKR